MRSFVVDVKKAENYYRLQDRGRIKGGSVTTMFFAGHRARPDSGRISTMFYAGYRTRPDSGRISTMFFAGHRARPDNGRISIMFFAGYRTRPDSGRISRRVGGAEQEHSLSKARVKHDGAWSPNGWVVVTSPESNSVQSPQKFCG